MTTCHRKFLEARCRERGYTLETVMPCVIAQDGDQWTIDINHAAYPQTSKPGFVPPPPDGPGTRLKAILRDWLGIDSTAMCSCSTMAWKMDLFGPEWCEGEGMASILEVMRQEHAKRWADGRTILPWTDAGARQLVLLACRRARAKAG